jgi:hypothetical protein
MSQKTLTKNVKILMDIAQNTINNGIILIDNGKALIEESEKAKSHNHILQAQGAELIHNGQAAIKLGDTLLLNAKEIIFAKKHIKGKLEIRG